MSNENVKSRQKKRWERVTKIAEVLGADKQKVFGCLKSWEDIFPLSLARVEKFANGVDLKDEVENDIKLLLESVEYQRAYGSNGKQAPAEPTYSKSGFDKFEERISKRPQNPPESENPVLRDIRKDVNLVMWTVEKLGSIEKLKEIVEKIEHLYKEE